MKKVIYVLLLSIFLQPSFARDSEPKIIGEFFYIAGGTGVSEYMVPVSIELMTYQKVRFGYTLVAKGGVSNHPGISLADDKNENQISIYYIMLNCVNKTLAHRVYPLDQENTANWKIYNNADAYHWDGTINKDYGSEFGLDFIRPGLIPQEAFQAACDFVKTF